MANQRRFTKEQRAARDKIYKRIPKFPFYVEEYVEDMFSSKSSPITLSAYLFDFEQFFSWLMSEGLTDSKEIRDIPFETLENLSLKEAQSYFSFLEYRLELSDTAINRKKSALRSLFKFLTERTEDEDGESYFYRNVMAKIKINKPQEDISARSERMSEFVIDESDIVDFIHFIEYQYESFIIQNHEKKIEEYKKKNKKPPSNRELSFFKRDKDRNLAIVALLLASGIRVSELVNLTIDKINLHTKSLRVLRKGGMESKVYFREFAVPYLQHYIDIREQRYNADKRELTLFLTIQQKQGVPMSIRNVQYIIEKYSKAFPEVNERRSPHKLRHSFATAYAKKNSLYDLMKQLGHSSINTTVLYVNADDEEAKKAIDRLDQKDGTDL